MIDTQLVELAAKTAHEVNRVYCASLGDTSQVCWADAPEWQRDSARIGVMGVMTGNGPGDSHRDWLAHKTLEGWVWGPIKDPVAKAHPCMVPFEQLSPAQQWKDHLYVAVVRSVLGLPAWVG